MSSKTKLLIIDPQNDFSEVKYSFIPKYFGGINRGNGSLYVSGSNGDYNRIIYFIENNNIDEIHVSLDTHTKNNISNANFWLQNNKPAKPYTILESKLKDNNIIDTNGNVCIPKNKELYEYSKEYILKLEKYGKKGNTKLVMWPLHCLEKSKGNEVVEELKLVLDKYPTKVYYHIKGQNNLTEMYSIFSADVPLTHDNGMKTGVLKVDKYIYNGSNINVNLSGSLTYDDASNSLNLKTTLNDKLLNNLLGEEGSWNTVYICGQAKTHCVKNSIIDMMNYAESINYPMKKIILLNDCTSPIPNFEDDIEDIMKARGCSVMKSSNFKENYNYIYIILLLILVTILIIILYYYSFTFLKNKKIKRYLSIKFYK